MFLESVNKTEEPYNFTCVSASVSNQSKREILFIPKFAFISLILSQAYEK